MTDRCMPVRNVQEIPSEYLTSVGENCTHTMHSLYITTKGVYGGLWEKWGF